MYVYSIMRGTGYACNVCIMYTYVCVCVCVYVHIPYKWIYWRVKYLANQSVIVVGVTLIWRKALAAVHINSYKTLLALFKFGGRMKNHQLKSPPNIPRIRYMTYIMHCAEIKNQFRCNVSLSDKV